MRKLLSILLLAWSLSPLTFAQPLEVVMHDPGYIWGEGVGETTEEADAAAFADLSRKICVYVRSDFRSVEEQQRHTRGTDWSSFQSSSIDTRSHVALYNTCQKVEKKGKRFHVWRWIGRDELELIFAKRERRAREYERSAVNCEENGQVGEALKYHWWAYMMVRSLRDPNKAEDEDGHLLLHVIPERMTRALEDLSITSVSKVGDSVSMSFYFRGDKVPSMEFDYFDGVTWRRGASVRDGKTTFRMAPGALGEHIQIRIDYTGKGDAKLDTELSDILSSEDLPLLRDAHKIINR